MSQDINASLSKLLKDIGVARTDRFGTNASPTDLGTHPDVCEWLWSPKGIDLPAYSKTVFMGRPALQDRTGRVFTVGFGTVYIHRMPEGDHEPSDKARPKIRRFSDGKVIDLSLYTNEDWIFGRFRDVEQQWFLAESQRS